MDKRDNNISMLQDTLHILNKGYYRLGDKKVALKLSREEMAEAEVFLPEDIKNLTGFRKFTPWPAKRPCRYRCVNMDSFSYARKRQERYESVFSHKGVKPILVLNLANPVNPGGGVRRGATAQEEDLCRKSSLLESLEGPNAKEYYAYNRALKTNMSSDAIVITPQVEIIKDDQGHLLEESEVVAVMTCAAPMLTFGMEDLSQEEYEAMVYERIIGMLKVAAHLGYQFLVLGAFGCGAFRNDAKIISNLFAKAFEEFEYEGKHTAELFGRIEFAVLDHSLSKYNFREFYRNFKGIEKHPKKHVEKERSDANE